MKSVEQLCELIQRYHLMPSADFAAMRSRWFRPGRSGVADPEQFRRWLVLNHYLTEFVVKVLSGSKSDQLVLNQFRLQDNLTAGPMAGAYLATDPLHRQVAIEVLSASTVADAQVLGGVVQAANKAMKVQHPNVGRIIDIGEARGLHFIAKEYYKGTTLAEVLERRGRLPYLSAARLTALALAGLEALHEQGVPAGDLGADCLLLAPAGKGALGQYTVKILHAGIRRQLFDDSALGRSGIRLAPDDLQLADASTFRLAVSGTPNVVEDVFRLGCIFYSCVTGQPPFAPENLPEPDHPARPVAQLAPDVPPMLCQIIEQMIDPAPAQRPQRAAHVAKSLRVFLATEDEARESKPAEHVIAPSRRTAPQFEDEDEEEVANEEHKTRPAARKRRSSSKPEQGFMDKVAALWDEYQPNERDLLFFTLGPFAFIVLVMALKFITGWTLTNILCLMAGASISYFIERFMKWRERRRD
jgi:serine/threonine protein kinase